MDVHRKNVYVHRATTAIVASLDVIAPGDAGHLWEALQSSRRVEKALGIAKHQPVKRKYLEALAETYQHATSWDTRKQVLAIIAGLVPFREIQKFIPGLTEYRFKAAQLRISKYGCGAAVPLNRSNVTQDWAMKFLPVKFWETQADWYGERGISWYISVVVRRATDGKLGHQAFVHVAQNCSQDSKVVVSVINHILRTLKVEHPEIRRASFRQDNAGCCHSATLLAACRLMQQTTGIKVKRVDFSDPQGGKGPCDRKAATIKAHVRRFVDEGHDVLTATDLRDAILSNKR